MIGIGTQELLTLSNHFVGYFLTIFLLITFGYYLLKSIFKDKGETRAESATNLKPSNKVITEAFERKGSVMKCKKCAGDLPWGAYGKVKCEYCNTINNVPTPEQERERKIEREEVSGKKWMSTAVLIVILGIVGSVAAFVPLVSVQESYTTTETQYKTVSYQEQEPYTTQEAYAEKEPYSDTETVYRTETYQDQECQWVKPNWACELTEWGKDYYLTVTYTCTNLEDQAIRFWDKLAYVWDEVTYGTAYESWALTPYGQKTATYNFGFPRTEVSGGYLTYIDSGYDKIEDCKTVTKTKEVPETQTVTKYRDVTKTRDVTKYRTVTKTKEVPEDVQVPKTRTVKKTLLEYLLS